ncbi:MAG: response regulator transcription factor [Calditrichaeota bacterium]|nr:response regulator transcription factor [Calditrichota bacterium]MCB0268972.1 response regulator transcription factor [Calditrichota bacterium]MCB0285437.1 response regulator transcription factor [Calditrichota bacterium]MCB0298766.1 response regulator transcription factor [Calditrichota bacterium]MCB9070220.1 response regulator transcription factor [Calditrichia bacterium]
MLQIGIVEDDADIRTAMVNYLNRQNSMRCDLIADSVESFLKLLEADSLPDVVLMDIGLPGMSGIDGIRIIKDQHPDIDIIMLTVYHDSHKIFNSLCAGASGYLLKNTPLEEIKNSIETLHDGGAPMSPQIARKVIQYFQPGKKLLQKKSPLTPKEKEIVVGLVDGLSYKMIADRMDISIETVRYHIKNIYQKLHVHSKAEVISKSLRGEI